MNEENRWRNMVFNKSITEEESLKFYDTWAETVNFVKLIYLRLNYEFLSLELV